MFWWGNVSERDYLDPGIDGKIILRRIFRTWFMVVWIGLAEDRYRWWALGNAVMSLRVP